MVNMFGSDDDLSGHAGVYTFKSSENILDMWKPVQCGIKSQSCKQFYWILVANVTFSEAA